MTALLLTACIGMITGAFLIFRISPMDFTLGVFHRLTVGPRSIRDEINEATQRKKPNFIRREILEAQTILKTTGKEDRFPMLCAASLLFFAVGAGIAMQLFDALKSVEGEKTLADAEYQRQLDSIESLKRQREMLVAKRIQLIKAIAEKEQANDDNARIVKYAAMSIEVLREFKVRLQREKVAKLSSTATKCFLELVEKDSLVSEIKIDPTTLDVTILDLDGNELLKSQLSAGEQQMFAVAIVWALALTSGYKAPVIIDTPMARLDSSHRANFVTKYLPAASSQVMVLSTDEEVYGRYLDLVRDNVVDYYTLLYREEEQCTSIVHGYFGEV